MPLDNNPAERALRGPGRRAQEPLWLQVRRGTEASTIFYSLLESVKLVGVDPAAYLQRCVDAHLAGTPIPLPHEITAAR